MQHVKEPATAVGSTNNETNSDNPNKTDGNESICKLYNNWKEFYASQHPTLVRPITNHTRAVLINAFSTCANTRWDTIIQTPGLGVFVTIAIPNRQRVLDIVHHFFHEEKISYKVTKKEITAAHAFLGLEKQRCIVHITKGLFCGDDGPLRVPILKDLMSLSTRSEVFALTPDSLYDPTKQYERAKLTLMTPITPVMIGLINANHNDPVDSFLAIKDHVMAVFSDGILDEAALFPFKPIFHVLWATAHLIITNAPFGPSDLDSVSSYNVLQAAFYETASIFGTTNQPVITNLELATINKRKFDSGKIIDEYRIALAEMNRYVFPDTSHQNANDLPNRPWDLPNFADAAASIVQIYTHNNNHNTNKIANDDTDHKNNDNTNENVADGGGTKSISYSQESNGTIDQIIANIDTTTYRTLVGVVSSPTLAVGNLKSENNNNNGVVLNWDNMPIINDNKVIGSTEGIDDDNKNTENLQSQNSSIEMDRIIAAIDTDAYQRTNVATVNQFSNANNVNNIVNTSNQRSKNHSKGNTDAKAV